MGNGSLGRQTSSRNRMTKLEMQHMRPTSKLLIASETARKSVDHPQESSNRGCGQAVGAKPVFVLHPLREKDRPASQLLQGLSVVALLRRVVVHHIGSGISGNGPQQSRSNFQDASHPLRGPP